MARRPTYRWHLRQLMATRNMFATTDLIGPLAERGITLSAVQVYRLVTQLPERLNLAVLAALCDILEVGPAELIEVVVETGTVKKAVGATTAGARGGKAAPARRPTRARIVPE